MCSGREFQVDGADTEKARVEKLLVMPYGLAKRFVLEERRTWMEGSGRLVQRCKTTLGDMKCFQLMRQSL